MDWDNVLKEHEASLRSAFKVRVRLGECRHMGSWHGTIEDGAVGRILPGACIDLDAPDDHNYYVWFDQPLRGRVSWSYSAAELIPISIEEMVASLAKADEREG